jgi:hypothetical protein
LHIVVSAGHESLSWYNEFIQRYVQTRYRASIAESVSIASMELLENGVAYASMFLPIVFELFEQEPFVVVRVANGAIGARSSRLLELVGALSKDSKAVYDGQLQKGVRGAPRVSLGLARVAHEAGMRLDAKVEGNRVMVTAYRKT